MVFMSKLKFGLIALAMEIGDPNPRTGARVQDDGRP